MAVERMEYVEARKQMKPGDIIAFGGKGQFSNIIKWATRASVSHVGVILQSKVVNDDEDRFLNLLIESTSLNGFNGVSISRASERVGVYGGEIWWLPLAKPIYDLLDQKKFYNFLLEQNHKPYDMPQAVNSALDMLDNTPIVHPTLNREDFGKFFCSELVCAGLEAGGVLRNVNASEVTPIDLCMFNLYADNYVQLKGIEKEIRGYNSIPPIGWGKGDVPSATEIALPVAGMEPVAAMEMEDIVMTGN